MDLQRASSLELDAPEGVTYFGNTFYQLNTSEYKTSKSGGKSRLILPLTLPIFSLSGCHWFQNWLAARDRLGLPVQGAITPPLIRSVGAQGDTPRPFNTSEVNSILAKIAKPGEPIPTSRSLKAQLGSQSGSISPLAQAVGLPCGRNRAVSEHLLSRPSGTTFEGIGPGSVTDGLGGLLP